MDPKPGAKTTEFYISLLVIFLGGFLSSGLLPDTHWSVKLAGAVMAALGALGYTAGRAKIKAAMAENPPPGDIR